MSALLSW